MKNDADFGDACCQRAAATSRLTPRQLEGRMEKKAPRKLVCSFGQICLLLLYFGGSGSRKKKIQFKNYCCTLLVARWLLVVCCCWLLVARCTAATCDSSGPQKHVDYFKRLKEKWLCEEQHNLLPATCPKFFANGSLKV